MVQPGDTRKWSLALVRVLLFCLGSAFILATTSRLTQSIPKPWSDYISLAIATILTFGLTLLFLLWEGLDLNEVGLLPGQGTAFRLGVGFLIGMVLAGSQVLLLAFLGHLKLEFFPETNWRHVLSAFLLYVIVAFREELAFRGYPLRSLNYTMRSGTSVLIMSVIFSLEHKIGGMSWTIAFLGSGVGAILFGLAALKTKGIAMPIGIHAAWNFVQWILGFKNRPGIWKAVVEDGFERRIEYAGLVSYVLVMVLAIAAFYWIPLPVVNDEKAGRLLNDPY